MNIIYWFRNDLRTHDHTGLAEATKKGLVIGVYCLNPNWFKKTTHGFKKAEKYRAKFLLETLNDLRRALAAKNIPLIVLHDTPANAIPPIVQQYDIKEIHLQKEWTYEEQTELNEVKERLDKTTQIHENYGQFLFHPDDIPFAELSSIPEIFTLFRKKCEKYCPVRVEAAEILIQKEHLTNPKLLAPIPKLTDLGFDNFEQPAFSAFPFPGGETAAMERLKHYFWDTEKLKYYKKTRNGLVGVDYSSKFSPWLANGSLSPRFIYYQVKQFEKKVSKNQDTYWMVFELIWRDYFKYVSLKHGNKIFHLGGILSKEYLWGNEDEKLLQWINGQTPDDFVNANMIELAKTGWMSNRGRQNVASYWAKEWEQDWRIGAAYFESLLIDYDVHSNWGNWMYNSGVGNDPRDRKFNTQLQAEKYDSDRKFRQRWLQQTLF